MDIILHLPFFVNETARLLTIESGFALVKASELFLMLKV
jgi:hypothetical protein